MFTILFLCTGNSCRSIMAEAVLNHFGQGKFRALSAGSFPTGKVHPLSLATLKTKYIPAEGYSSKSWDEFANTPIDLVITVCDQAAGETCPIFPGKPAKAHWSIPDPAYFEGSADEKEAEFMRVYSLLERRIKRLISLPFHQFTPENLAGLVSDLDKE